MMRFVFDASQEHQLNAIDAVVQLFQGLPHNESAMEYIHGTGFAVKNTLTIDHDALLLNLHTVQEQNHMPKDTALQLIASTIPTVHGEKSIAFPNFSIEMETGTGKTYVYTRTALELCRRYGIKKFIIVVPSVAIREGVLKSFQITEQHLKELYDNLPFRYYVYDSQNLSSVRQFAASNNIEFFIMTIDSFNKALKEGNKGNVIFKSTDRLQGGTPVHFIQATHPVLILDEPQNMESELRIKALSNLNPLFALRYSATHRNSYNPTYKLTPADAYRQGLVKKVAVAGFEQEGDTVNAFVRLECVQVKKRTFTANLLVHVLSKDGTVKEKSITVRPDDILDKKTNRSDYADLTIEEMGTDPEFIRFTNGIELQKGQTLGADKQALFRDQIRYTVEEHFRKQRELKQHNIKVLSLFFIDQVDNYAKEDGLIKVLFNEAYNDLKEKYTEWKKIPSENVQAAYFAAKHNRAGETIYEDTSGLTERDTEAYDLIMKDKERLLSFDEPTCFIFSHSALREGWDNPNVFQICTLNMTRSELKKRQEIGRGVRLSVNQEGKRVHDDRINVLTVVANENYEKYVRDYQNEIAEEYGTDGVPPKPVNARKRVNAKCRKKYLLKPEFKALWERIKHRTRYAVSVDSSKLIADVVSDLDRQTIRKARITVTKGRMEVDQDGAFQAIRAGHADKTELQPTTLPNILAAIIDQLERTTPPIRITKTTLLTIYKQTKLKTQALDNPHDFIALAARIIKQHLAEQLVEGIQYEKDGRLYDQTLLEADIPLLQEYIEPCTKIDGTAGTGLYDYVGVDSDIERQFIKDLEKRDDVKLYIKLPGWFEVTTPIGNYNPDWAIVLTKHDAHGKPQDTLYLVAETKSTTDRTKLRTDERRKIQCGEKHFTDTLKVPYTVVTSADELPQ